jgi:hypothetical protein
MAFPTSSLTNNQVHKEGNRAFVYDSTLGVWDQVRETDRTENKILSGTIGNTDIATFPAGHIVKINAFHDDTETAVSGGGTGVEILDINFTAKASNSAYYLNGVIAATNNDTTSSADAGDRGVTAWLQNSVANEKYRFGYRKTALTRHDELALANDYYLIWDSDGGIGGNTWHQWPLPIVWVSGNQPTYESTTVVKSSFIAGETITLKVWVASQNGCYINRSNMGSSSNASHSHYSVIEVAT